jgi:hypothetical protein
VGRWETGRLKGQGSKESLRLFEVRGWRLRKAGKMRGKIHHPDEIRAKEISLGRQRTQRTQRG